LSTPKKQKRLKIKR